MSADLRAAFEAMAPQARDADLQLRN